MNKFVIVSCVELDKGQTNNGYVGPAIVLNCVADPSIVLFFPIASDKAATINYLIKDGEYGINTDILGVYKTMIESWDSGNRFLSGIIIDCIHDEELNDEIMNVELAISDSISGFVDSVVPVSFVNAMMLAAMQQMEVIVTTKLINKLLPEESEEETEENETPSNASKDKQTNKFPEDGKILDIVKGIMDGNFFEDKGEGNVANSSKIKPLSSASHKKEGKSNSRRASSKITSKTNSKSVSKPKSKDKGSDTGDSKEDNK